MLYKDLITKTAKLPEGRHLIYKLSDGELEIRNVGQRHEHLSARPEHRLHVLFDQRELTPRHGDFFTDFLLKIETRPELRMAITEACEMVCNGADPLESFAHKKLPKFFAEWGEETWSYQMAMYQTGGLPTDLMLAGIQLLIRCHDLNDPSVNWPEQFRQAYVALEKGSLLLEVVTTLKPRVMPGKRYFDRLERTTV
jgi:hypothetical protein